MSRLSEITNPPLSKPIEIEQVGFVWQGYAVVISISQILVSDSYYDFPRFVQILQIAHSPCQLNSNPVCILFFSGGIHFDWNKILYTSFFIYILSKAQQRIMLLYMYNMIYKYNDLKIIRLKSKN